MDWIPEEIEHVSYRAPCDLTPLTNLTELDMKYSNELIKFWGLGSLTRLSEGGIVFQVTELVNLNSLNLRGVAYFQDSDLIKLTNLTELNLAFNTQITDQSHVKLQLLASLDLSGNSKISDLGLTNCRQLKSLKLKNFTDPDPSQVLNITLSGLATLKNLKELDIQGNGRFHEEELRSAFGPGVS